MRLSYSRALESIWVWTLWTAGIFLVLELVPFLLAIPIFRKTLAEVAVPYLAFALPALVFFPVIWWLRKWEERGWSPKQTALAWSLCTTIFMLAVLGAAFYTGVVFRLIPQQDVAGAFTVTCICGLLGGPITMYRNVLKMATARVAKP